MAKIGPYKRHSLMDLYVGATTFSIKTPGLMTFSIMTLSMKGLSLTLSINDTQHNNKKMLHSA
jgi:hypothetical protein